MRTLRFNRLIFVLLVGLPMLGFGQAATSVPDLAESYIKAIEGVQDPEGEGAKTQTLDELMKQFGVSGLSVAVIKDFKIH